MAAMTTSKMTDIKAVDAALHFLDVRTRMPLKFGSDTLTSVTCVRVRVVVADAAGRCATGWGETPLSVQWVWPGSLPYEPRHDALKQLCRTIGEALLADGATGHPVEIIHDFQHHALDPLLDNFNRAHGLSQPVPYLAALLCLSAFDIALHDAFGQRHEVDVYRTYNREFMSRDLAAFLEPVADAKVDFTGRYIEDYLVTRPPRQLAAWHLVGGLDPIEPSQLTGNEPDDDYPVLLRDWIRTDQLKCLKIKLRGNDAPWDYQRLVQVGSIALEENIVWLTADFNCMVDDPAYVNQILDQLRDEQPRIYGSILYVEQPFAYDLKAHHMDVRSVAARKPLFLDESAHDWRYVRLGRELGWSGVALKTCKTQTGALLSLCWAKAHGMPVMVQDLTNPMLAQIPHVRLAAHAGTIMGVETNGMQFYPQASHAEAQVHPGLYQRRGGMLNLSTLHGPGFGYRLHEINRQLPREEKLSGT